MSIAVDNSDSDSDIPQLSAATLNALSEFYAEKHENHLITAQEDSSAVTLPPEDWQLSQFWYDADTAETLAREAVSAVGLNGKVACVSCPSVFELLQRIKPDHMSATLFEYDARFEMFQPDFVFYDYKNPMAVPDNTKEAFDLVILDPPFLSNECLCKVAITVRLLAKDKIIVCTGAVMEEMVGKLLQVTRTNFVPKHKHYLGNVFACFTNYKATCL